MPYTWTEQPDRVRLRLWPHQSLTARGFVWFIGSTALLLLVPLLAVLGSPVLWVLMVFIVAAVAGIWRAIMVNRSRMEIWEELTLDGDAMHLRHVSRSGQELTWDANPYWVTVHLHPRGKVKNYLTLRGGGREVELGAFLDPDERATLYSELLGRLKTG